MKRMTYRGYYLVVTPDYTDVYFVLHHMKRLIWSWRYDTIEEAKSAIDAHIW